MLAAERKNLILEELQENKKVVVNELSEKFKVSEETIRRDLDKLEKEGICTKGYGGAVLCESPGIDMPSSVRRKKNTEGKKKIAKIMSEIVKDGDNIFLDSSTSAQAILKEIRSKRVTIITNSIELLLEAAEENEWTVLSTGGQLDEQYMTLVGSKAISYISEKNADKVIFSCKGIDMEKGITDSKEQFSQIKESMIKSAKVKILAIDSSKFNYVAFSKICSLTDIDMIVTDRKPDNKWLEFFNENNIECKYAE